MNSPLWAVLADWIKIILTLPDPAPEQLVGLNDIAILTAISALTGWLSPAAGKELRKGLAVAYKDAMGKLMHQFPDDLDAAALYAESMMDLNPGNAGPRTEGRQKGQRKSCPFRSFSIWEKRAASIG